MWCSRSPSSFPARRASASRIGPANGSSTLTTMSAARPAPQSAGEVGSAALVADAWNDAVDILSAGGALTAVTLSNYDPARFLAADHYGGFVVGMIVAGTGIRVMRDASLDLVDTMPPADFTRALEAVAVSVPGVVGVEKRFARKTGLQYHVDLHIEVDPQLTVAASHDIASEVRVTLKRELPWVADVLVHVEPAAHPENLENP